MISRSEFEALEARVTNLEASVKLTPIRPPQLHIPYTILIEKTKFTTSDIENTAPFYNQLENDHFIFIRIYVHGKNFTPKTTTKIVNGFYEYMFIQNFYNVLVIQHSDLGTVGEHVWPKMNTINY